MSELERLREDGYVILADMLDAAQLRAAREGLAPHLQGERLGRNPFEGHLTERVYTLVARAPVFAELALHPRVLALVDALLAPNYLLTISQAINIRPGEAEQALHSDDSFYAIPRPRPAISVSTIWAVDDFTAENGATQILPGSHRWDDQALDRLLYMNDFATRPKHERVARRRDSDAAFEAQLRQVIMPAGSAIFFLGTLVHRGGANRSGRARLALTYQYCEPWARQQENYALAVPPEQARAMAPALQAMLGYSIHPPFMGHVGGMHPLRRLEDAT